MKWIKALLLYPFYTFEVTVTMLLGLGVYSYLWENKLEPFMDRCFKKKD